MFNPFISAMDNSLDSISARYAMADSAKELFYGELEKDITSKIEEIFSDIPQSKLDAFHPTTMRFCEKIGRDVYKVIADKNDTVRASLDFDFTDFFIGFFNHIGEKYDKEVVYAILGTDEMDHETVVDCVRESLKVLQKVHGKDLTLGILDLYYRALPKAIAVVPERLIDSIKESISMVEELQDALISKREKELDERIEKSRKDIDKAKEEKDEKNENRNFFSRRISSSSEKKEEEKKPRFKREKLGKSDSNEKDLSSEKMTNDFEQIKASVALLESKMELSEKSSQKKFDVLTEDFSKLSDAITKLTETLNLIGQSEKLEEPEEKEEVVKTEAKEEKKESKDRRSLQQSGKEVAKTDSAKDFVPMSPSELEKVKIEEPLTAIDFTNQTSLSWKEENKVIEFTYPGFIFEIKLNRENNTVETILSQDKGAAIETKTVKSPTLISYLEDTKLVAVLTPVEKNYKKLPKGTKLDSPSKISDLVLVVLRKQNKKSANMNLVFVRPGMGDVFSETITKKDGESEFMTSLGKENLSVFCSGNNTFYEVLSTKFTPKSIVKKFPKSDFGDVKKKKGEDEFCVYSEKVNNLHLG